MGDVAVRRRSAPERQEWILTVLHAKGFLSVADMAAELRVSHMTVRRDLRLLEQDGRVRVVYGGATLSAGPGPGADAGDIDAAGARIAAAAAHLVGADDVIAIDTRSFGYQLAQALPETFGGTVVTNAMPVIRLLAGRPRPPHIIGLGGELLPDGRGFVGPTTTTAIAGLRVRTLFLSADATDHRGAYARSDAEAPVQRGLVDIADRVVLLADHARFTDSAPLLLAEWSRITVMVTDRPPPRAVARALHLADVQTVVTDGRGPDGGHNLVPEPRMQRTVAPLPTRVPDLVPATWSHHGDHQRARAGGA